MSARSVKSGSIYSPHPEKNLNAFFCSIHRHAYWHSVVQCQCAIEILNNKWSFCCNFNYFKKLIKDRGEKMCNFFTLFKNTSKKKISKKYCAASAFFYLVNI